MNIPDELLTRVKEFVLDIRMDCDHDQESRTWKDASQLLAALVNGDSEKTGRQPMTSDDFIRALQTWTPAPEEPNPEDDGDMDVSWYIGKETFSVSVGNRYHFASTVGRFHWDGELGVDGLYKLAVAFMRFVDSAKQSADNSVRKDGE